MEAPRKVIEVKERALSNKVEIVDIGEKRIIISIIVRRERKVKE